MLALLKLLVALAVYGTAIEPRFVVTDDEVAAIPNLPPAWELSQLAVISDMHVGMWWANRDAIGRAVHDIVAIHPAALLILGDFVYNADSSAGSQMVEVASLLKPILDAGIPVFAVLGNHDYSLMNEHSDEHPYVADQVRDAATRAGIHMLDNASVGLRRGSDTASGVLYLAGVGERWAKNDDVSAALSQVPAGAPRILFMHDPDTYAKIPAGAAPLAIAGHTHAMQFDVPWLSDWLWRHYFSDTGSGLQGWVSNYGAAGNHLYINRGLGFSIVPARINAVPQLTVFHLVRDTTAVQVK